MNNTKQNSSKKDLIGQVDQAQIDKWKEDYGSEVYYFTDQGRIAYFKSPGRLEVGTGMTKGFGNMLEQAIGTMEACFLGGSEELMRDDTFLVSSALRFDELTVVRKVEMGKL